MALTTFTAYLTSHEDRKETSLRSGANVIKLFTALIHEDLYLVTRPWLAFLACGLYYKQIMIVSHQYVMQVISMWRES